MKVSTLSYVYHKTGRNDLRSKCSSQILFSDIPHNHISLSLLLISEFDDQIPSLKPSQINGSGEERGIIAQHKSHLHNYDLFQSSLSQDEAESILGIQISGTSCEDKCAWHFNEFGNYFMKSEYLVTSWMSCWAKLSGPNEEYFHWWRIV